MRQYIRNRRLKHNIGKIIIALEEIIVIESEYTILPIKLSSSKLY